MDRCQVRRRPRAVVAADPPQVLVGGAQIVTVSGRLRNIVSCTGGEHAILEVLSNGQTLRLYIDDGLKISVRGHTGSTIDLSCRAYDTPIKIDSCPTCHGVFVEDQELAAIHAAVDSAGRARVTAALRARGVLAGRPPSAEKPEETVSGLIQALHHWREHQNA